ncbi:MAG: hypothetical protein E3J26_06240 [Candidatus Zixiibacteriota bacterium]|nr:MAG: hypothetical protein E3J26_06240 [candidate division Zixibacteria bacterium]
MESLDLLAICASAFVGVFLLLTVLALVMRLIIVLFPERESASDSAMIAAVSTVLQTVYPGTKITKVEEIK